MFNMAHMGLRLAQRANGVSKLHGAVSRGMFGGLWEGFDADEVPIGSVTNGVHGTTWEAREVAGLLGEPDHPRGEVSDGELWDAAQRPARPAGRRGAPPRAGGVAAARRLAARSWAGPSTCSTRTCSPSGSPAACRPTSGSR